MTLDLDRPINCWIHKLYADREDENCRNRVIQVIVYPNVQSLRAAAVRYARKTGRSDDFADTAGCFHPAFLTAKYDRRRKRWVDTTKPFAGVMRLAQTHLTDEIVAHECVHAALHVTRLHDWATPGTDGNANFGDSCDQHEEAFAYLLGSLTSEVLNIAKRVQEQQH